MNRARACRFSLSICCLALLTACAPRLAVLPTGPGAPFAGFREAYGEATRGCRGVTSLAALLGLSGRAGDTRLRGRIEAGFASPGMVRLDALGPFGSRPVFTLVSRNGDATLLLPRDGRVLVHEPPEAVIEALAGVSLGPDELRAALTGCGFPGAQPDAGRTLGGEWALLESDASSIWLRRVRGAWQLHAAARGPLEVRYSDFRDGRPYTVRLRTTGQRTGRAADITLSLSEVDLNIDLGPEVFAVRVPPDAVPLTLDELRRAGPLGASDDR